MIRNLTIALMLTLGLNAHASVFTEIGTFTAQQAVMGQVETAGLNLKKGDTANFSLNMSIIQGTMVMAVHDIVADGVWIHQNVDMSFAGKQKIEILIDPNTGETKKLIVNGKEEKTPDQGDVEVIETKEETISVPAGQFTCLYIKVKTKDGEAQQWVNMKQVPVFGMVKSIMQSQFGPVTIELTSFKKM
jgi:hypothetical protein